jgi:D-alanyl-D-alanine carboxypeptidase
MPANGPGPIPAISTMRRPASGPLAGEVELFIPAPQLVDGAVAVTKDGVGLVDLVFPDFQRSKIQNPFGLQLRQEAAVATVAMAKAMKDEGAGTLILNSGFRTYKTQQALYNRTRDTRGLAVAEKLSARPGHSEHQLGLAADFSARAQGCVILTCFGNTEAGRWLEQNAHEYGFILRYPKGYRAITGFQYEPWHFRYVGVELATEMKTKGIKTLEEFWGLESAPDYTQPAG